MGVSIYYTARRSQPLSPTERKGVGETISRFPIENLIRDFGLKARAFNGESFSIYEPADPAEPSVVLKGATKLPGKAAEACWAALQYWCLLLTEIRRALPDAEWDVSVDDHDIQWDPKLNRFDPSA